MTIAVVTGASSGMGREAVIRIAERFGKIGEIWVIARRQEQLEQLRKEALVPLRIFPLDLTESGSLDVLRRALEEAHPKVRLLVNAAGYGKYGKVGEAALAEETNMVRLNCEALCGVTHLVLPYLSDHSRILMFASAAGFLPQPGFATYAATKAFVVSYSRALNAELKSRDIVVTAVCPGPVDTAFFTVAKTHAEMPSYKKRFMASPRRVVRKALRDSIMGKSMSIYSPAMKGFRLLCKVLPHGLILLLEERMAAGGEERTLS
ncbi:MAG: SDR family NAD(P)-dependent oxidoreductase [Lachnospiraceae bacterium]|jgi:short-subunit dehydrogenase|nr:SDR family NAD(P)-dependent oxidoreductase [Lachnospiraceae bacterium]